MDDFLIKFEKKYGHLKKKGLIIDVLVGINSPKMIDVINISKPFVFDNRLIPEKFNGIPIKKKIYGGLPTEFNIKKGDQNVQPKEYIWSPERFELFIDRSAEKIKNQLGSPKMSREEMLDALCFGDFEKHRQKCMLWVEEGKIPTFIEIKTC